MNHVYKIRNRKTGLFSCGGTSPRFTKDGKIWSKIGHVKCHISQVRYYGRGRLTESYKDCDLIIYNLDPVNACPAEQI